ncbi:hypothetical protein PINS_up010207 [Pythium insidiosum]|nr:hypothetical protein PINS_up010207 [Pythium insidiosum]
MVDADAGPDRITYSIEYLRLFQPICDAVPCHFPDVVRAPRPQRLGRYVNGRLVYSIPELLQFQLLYQMPPPNLQWSDTLAIISPPDVKAKAAAKTKKEKAAKKSAAASTPSAQLQYDPTLMCYFNPTEYTAALNMAMNSSKDGTATSSSDPSARGALDLSTGTSATGSIVNPVEEAVNAKRRIASLLDDVRPENVATILQSFEEIEITCTATLQELIGFLFDRAIAAADHCEGFAQLFSGISERTPEFKEGAKTINFRRILLTKCYEALIEESETPVNQHVGVSSRTNNSTNSPTHTQPQLHHQQSWRRQCMLQNVCFIGELFRRQLLTENVMHVCVAMMLEDEENPQMDIIEAACRLLSLVGDLLDGSSPASRRTMDEYFDVLQRLSAHSDAPESLRELISETIIVRAGGWAKKRLEATAAGASSPAARSVASVALQPLTAPAATTSS